MRHCPFPSSPIPSILPLSLIKGPLYFVIPPYIIYSSVSFLCLISFSIHLPIFAPFSSSCSLSSSSPCLSTSSLTHLKGPLFLLSASLHTSFLPPLSLFFPLSLFLTHSSLFILSFISFPERTSPFPQSLYKYPSLFPHSPRRTSIISLLDLSSPT